MEERSAKHHKDRHKRRDKESNNGPTRTDKSKEKHSHSSRDKKSENGVEQKYYDKSHKESEKSQKGSKDYDNNEGYKKDYEHREGYRKDYEHSEGHRKDYNHDERYRKKYDHGEAHRKDYDHGEGYRKDYDHIEGHRKEFEINEGSRKGMRRGNASEREHSRVAKSEGGQEESNEHRRERHQNNSTGHHKSSSKLERENKRSKHEGEQRSGARSSRSPSPSGRKEREKKEWGSRDRGVDKEGSNRYSRRSGLGGYSPRRRRSEAAVRTPSPTPQPPRSPERKKARAWDLPPAGMDSGVAAAMAAVAAQQAAAAAAAQQAAAIASVSSLVTVNSTLATVSLTQGTRNLRRLYIGNIPSTVSEGELTEFVNAAMLSVNANHIPGTKPCINCMVNVEKSYAFAEFLTAEDATAGLAFDGITLHGTTLKIRRPRDYIPPPSGGLDYASAVDMVSSVVLDSPQKIFVGAICKTLCAEKVKEIVTAFGQLKAYHWEVIVENDQREACAFLEYLDPSITLKACAGLNGMRLGSKILTVVQATPNASSESDVNGTPFYGIPEQARPLLQAPTRILEFQNVISEEEALALSEAELLEIVEDVCLECKRFGTVKSTHVVKRDVKCEQITNGDQAGSVMILEGGSGDAYMTEDEKKFAEYIASVESQYLHGVSEANKAHAGSTHTMVCVPPSSTAVEEETVVPANSSVKEASECLNKVAETEVSEPSSKLEGTSVLETSETSVAGDVNGITTEPSKTTTAMVAEGEAGPVSTMSSDNNNSEDMLKSEETKGDVRNSTSNLVKEKSSEMDEDISSEHTEEGKLGRVYVEFTREETASAAAHVLHGRVFGDRKVRVSYFPVKLYQKWFGKGLEPRTHEEKQALALAAQEHLNTYLPERD